jgi:uncharacterized repeat protein (TIGR03837 family)
MNWDIFCSVVDNFGDIGITWRLARQLANEHHIAVRLWVDDLAAFQRIRPEIDSALATQTLAGVEVRHWRSPLPDVTPGAVVIEAVACNLPDEFVARMAARNPKPVWLNLEYLTAEVWAKGVHGLPSPHPRLPLTKFFFMPGFDSGTGGLLRETRLIQRRVAFQANSVTRIAFWAGLGLPREADGELRVSLFSYDNAALPGLLDAWASGARPVRALVPVGKALPEIAAWFGLDTQPEPGIRLERGALTLHILPMLCQDDYDRLLWACDLNFVRGEDSFVRAQFAAQPMVWQVYRQEEEAHFAKLAAFLDLYCADMDGELAMLTRAAWQSWNRESDFGALWPSWLDALPALGRHGQMWCDHLAQQVDLVSNLLIFCKKKLE